LPFLAMRVSRSVSEQRFHDRYTNLNLFKAKN
jgi:hypothetical protein